jgi:RimJ/RimL family protein N-acetyltransferase
MTEASKSIELVSRNRDEVAATLNAMDASVRAQISKDWWEKFQASAFEDPWVHGFRVCLPGGAEVGMGSFKGPPVDGVVEIAYAIVPEHQGKGYATDAARAMTEHAFNSPEVSKVCAHTLPDGTASKRVLEKAGFTHVGEVVDPEDGLVWRFERVRPGKAGR